MIVPAPIFFVQHMATAFMLAKPFPKRYKAPLMAFGVVQGIIEHYADVFPSLASIGPALVLVAIGLTFAHYKFAYDQIGERKALAVAGLVGGGPCANQPPRRPSRTIQVGIPLDGRREAARYFEHCSSTPVEDYP